jgi:hypothetical protein
LNRFKRTDEKPFEAVAAISEFNQRAYELFAQPLVQAASNEYGAQLMRTFHPLRFSRWAVSDFNPWLAWLKPAADMVKAQRRPVSAEQPLRQGERAFSDLVTASFDYYRDLRDAVSEALFFQTYGNLFSLYLADKHEAEEAAKAGLDPRELPFVKQALASIAQGGYAEALARVGYMLARKGEPLRLESIELRKELLEDYRDLLPQITLEQARRNRGVQEIIVNYEPQRALETLPQLLAVPAERERFLALTSRLLNDERVQGTKPTKEQLDMLARIRAVLGVEGKTPARLEAPVRLESLAAPARAAS